MTPEEIEKAWNEIRQAVNAAYDLGAATKSDFPDMTPHYKALRHEMAVQAKMIEIQNRCLYELLGEGNKHIADEHAKDWRKQAEPENSRTNLTAGEHDR